MVQGLLEHLLNAKALDKWFDNNCGIQYTRKLLFSSVVAIMLEVVCQIRKSVNVAYQKADHITVSNSALYNKLNGLETNTSASLVRHIGQKTSALVREMKAEHEPWVKGLHTKLLDGNCIEASEKRLKPLRELASAALPGKSLVVFDPQVGIAIDVFPCENGHAQERSLLPDVLATVKKDDLWGADRNFCVQDFLFGIHDRKAFFTIREHDSMPVEALAEPKFIGETETGKVYEQPVRLRSAEGESYLARV